jgi:WD40 repeat protein
LSGDGKLVAAASADGSIKVWDATSPSEFRMIGGPPMTRITAVSSSAAWNPVRNQIATIIDGRADVWDPATSRRIFSVPGYPSRKLAFAPDGQSLVVAQRRLVTFWDSTAGALLTSLAAHDAPVYGVAFSPDGQLLATCAHDSIAGEIRLWDRSGGHPDQVWQAASPGVWDLVFSPDGQRLASLAGTFPKQDFASGERVGAVPGAVELRQVRDGKVRRVFTSPRHAIWAIAFSPDGQRLAAATGAYVEARSVLSNASNDDALDLGSGTLIVWDIATGEKVFETAGPGRPLFAVAYSPDGKRILAGGLHHSAGAPARIQCLDAQSGQELFALAGHRGAIVDLSFGPKRDELASASDDGTIRIWSGHWRPGPEPQF